MRKLLLKLLIGDLVYMNKEEKNIAEKILKNINYINGKANNIYNLSSKLLREISGGDWDSPAEARESNGSLLEDIYAGLYDIQLSIEESEKKLLTLREATKRKTEKNQLNINEECDDDER